MTTAEGLSAGLRLTEEGEPLHAGIVISLLSGCCQATVLVDSSAARGRRCSRCREECLPRQYEVRNGRQ